jgi:hypothetical protein
MVRRLPVAGLALALLMSWGSAPACVTAADDSWVCLRSFGTCIRPCQERCRIRFPASAWAWWREREFLDCVDHCTEVCLGEKKLCEERRATAR